MASLYLPKEKKTIEDFEQIKAYLNVYGVLHEKWEANVKLTDDSTQEQILDAYEHSLKPYMSKFGYKTADVINVHENTPNLLAIRQKFLPEHTHSEDEVRFFVDGEGVFWFNFGSEVAALTCRAGDLISVPAGYKHWFDLGPKAFVKAIRVFIDPAGWVANYTNSGIEIPYNPKYD
ncbi:MAG: 1,2-dihydroxy-3-keto-5-methylthiopentene dioxygenase [Bacteriovoracaceae bacterium]